MLLGALFARESRLRARGGSFLAARIPARLAPRVAFAAVAVKGLRFAPMNAPESGAPLTAVLAAAVLQLGKAFALPVPTGTGKRQQRQSRQQRPAVAR